MTTGEPGGPELALRLSHISKRFGSLLANDDISLTLRKGEVLALLGENGAGKTTLMNILFGHYTPDEGTVEVFGQTLQHGSPKAAIAAGLGMVHQHFTLADNLTVLENVTIGTEPMWRPFRSTRDARARLVDHAERFGLSVDPDQRVGDLSVGERQRVEILKALYREARILILDEPTAVLTPQESDHLFATLRRMVSDGLSIIFISHKLNEVMAVSHRIAVLRGGKVVGVRAKEEVDRRSLAALMVGREIQAPRRRPMPPGPPVLQLEQVSIVRPGVRVPLRDVDLRVRRHEIVGIAGVSGNGQSALADLVSGTTAPTAGRVLLHGHPLGSFNPGDMVERGIGRIPEDRHAEGLIADMPVWENLIAETYREPNFRRGLFVRRGAAKAHAQRLIREYDVRCQSPDAVTRLLSGGNMQKLVLGRALSREPDFILANQPTRGLDIGAVTYVHERLLEARTRGAGILLISEDLDEILTLSDRVAVIHGGRISNPIEREQVDVDTLGLLMAGEATHDAA